MTHFHDLKINFDRQPILDGTDLLSSLKKYLQESTDYLLQQQEAKVDPYQLVLLRTEIVDRLLRVVFAHFTKSLPPKQKMALASQGGYGRRELSLHSDIDLLILFQGKLSPEAKKITEQMIQTLWDIGLEVGVAIRNVSDCRRLMEEDLTILTSLLDVRYLAGEMALIQDLEKEVWGYFSKEKRQKQFYDAKIQENAARIERFGGSVYLLEPNLKEGEGALRDYHTLYWMARVRDRIEDPYELVTRGYCSTEEFEEYWKAVCFLWKLRNELHRRAHRRQDQLLFDFQESIARALGYENNEINKILGVELFMQEYYLHAKAIRHLNQKIIRRLFQSPTKITAKEALSEDPVFWRQQGKVGVFDFKKFEEDPVRLIKIFELAHREKCVIDEDTLDFVENKVSLIDESVQCSPEAGKIFRKLLSRLSGLGDVLTQMNDLGVLGAYLPEFKKLRCRVQHDIYHVYTVDTHLLFAVGELGQLFDGIYEKTHATLHQLIKETERYDLLAFATLYHDIGKGDGKGHVEKGAPLIRQAGERLGFSPAEVETLVFLELSHLLMTHLAFRRDLEDQNLIINFAKSMPNLEHLNMLYLQTFCDVKAVSAEAMTDWKASLLDYLYRKTQEVMVKGTYTKERASTLIPKVLEQVLSLFDQLEDKAKCREFFSMMPARYLLATPAALIADHVRLWERFAEDPIVFQARALTRENVNEVTLLTWEGSSLFSKMTGLFAAHHLNIIEAQLNLSNQGHALHTFKVTDPEGKPVQDEDRWKKIEKDLRDVLEGRVRIDNLVADKFKPSFFKPKQAQKLDTQIEIDNDISAFYTVIDIYTHDRVGLLYQITSTLLALGLYVDVSKISTKVDQVADTFYVKDIFGHKITSQERLKKIKDILQRVIEEEPRPGWRPPIGLVEVGR